MTRDLKEAFKQCAKREDAVHDSAIISYEAGT